MSGPGFIQEQFPEACEMCGIVAECRPYGPNDENICFDCAMKDEETTKGKMTAYLFGEEDGQPN
jgi:hypothetical protein